MPLQWVDWWDFGHRWELEPQSDTTQSRIFKSWEALRGQPSCSPRGFESAGLLRGAVCRMQKVCEGMESMDGGKGRDQGYCRISWGVSYR